MKRFRLTDITASPSVLFADIFSDAKIDHGGVYVFKPGEIAHPEPVHVHDTAEVFFIVQGKGILPIDGVEHPVETGDVVIVEAGEDHHLRSTEDDPLVSAWWIMAE